MTTHPSAILTAALRRCCIQPGESRWHDDFRIWLRQPFKVDGYACGSTGEVMLAVPAEGCDCLTAPPPALASGASDVLSAGKPVLAPTTVLAGALRAWISDGYVEPAAWAPCASCKGTGAPQGDGDWCSDCGGEGGTGGWGSLVYRGGRILGEIFNRNLLCRALLPLLTDDAAPLALGYVEPAAPVCVNPEAIGNPALTPVVQMPRSPWDLRALYVDGPGWRAVVMPMNPSAFSPEDLRAMPAFPAPTTEAP